MLNPRAHFGGLGNRLFQGAYIYAQVRKGLIPDIYIQDMKYWREFKEEIRKWYQKGISDRTNRVALHIRRGDYVNNSFYVDLTQTDYYDKALKEFPDERFLVFYADRQGTSDSKDRDWIRDWLEKKGVQHFEFYRGADEIDDLNKMASCRGLIGANSSFTWWAAFLNPNEDKKIVVPREYYTDKVERTIFPRDEGYIFI